MRKLFLAVCLLIFFAGSVFLKKAVAASDGTSSYKYQATKELVSLVKDAASAVEKKGEAVFPEFKKEGSSWRHGDTYIFVIDPSGTMILHPDPALEGKEEIGLKDVNGKAIIKGLIDAASSDKKEGWFHYQWPEPGSLFPLWKSSFVKLVTASSGQQYIVGSGIYNMNME
jgi:signal transduction histidine kinase